MAEEINHGVQDEPYIKYDVKPNLIICPYCNSSEEFDLEGKTFNEIINAGDAFNREHKNGRCKLKEGDVVLKNKAIELKLLSTGDILLNNKLIETDKELVAGLRKLLHGS